MKKKATMVIIVLLSVASIGFGQVNKKYIFSYDPSGNRILRTHDIIIQEISLTTGWNIFSANVLPEDRNLKNMLQSLINANYLLKVMDESGKVIENWGIYGGWVNNIGDILSTEGYQINVSANCILQISGDQILLPLNISLSAGWNIISYPQTAEVNAVDVVKPLKDQGKLTKVMDEAGKTYENWGVYGGWVNNIGSFKPGEGYKVKVNAVTQLTISDNYAKSAVVAVTTDKTGHFKPAYKGNGVDHMNINIVDIPSLIIEAGDEISAYDGKLCVGSIKITEQQINDNRIPLIVSSIDFKGNNGFTKGNKFELGIWKKATDTEYSANFELVWGNDKFEKHESRFVRITGITTGFNENMAALEVEEQQSNTEDTQQDTEEKTNGLSNSEIQVITLPEADLMDYSEASFRCYPNPLTDDVTIEFFMPEDSHVSLSIFSSTGQLMRSIIDGDEPKGTKQFIWKRNNQTGQKVPSGIYLCKLKFNNQSFDKKLIVR